MRRVLAATIAVVIAFALAACGGPDHGVVHDKSYSAAYTYLQCIPQAKGGCIYIPQTVPESWSIDVYNGDEHGWVSVTEQTYNAYKVGDSIDFREGR